MGLPPLRIVMLSSLLPPDYDGGFEMNVLKIARSLRARGHDVQVVTSEYRPTYSGPRDEPEWVHRIFKRSEYWDVYSGTQDGADEGLPKTGFARLISDFKANLLTVRAMAPLRNTIGISSENERILGEWLDRNERFDVGYVNILHLTGTGCTHALVDRGVPIMWHLGDEWLMGYATPQGKQGKILRLLDGPQFLRETSVDLSHVVLVSEFLRDRYVRHGYPAETTHVINRGIEFPLMPDVDRARTDPPTFFMACRVTAYKGVGVAIRAAARLHSDDPQRQWKLRIAGKASDGMREYFEAEARARGVADRLSFLGQISREQTIEEMRKATAFISASVYGEPFANTIIEALASGTPLIGSKAGSMEEVVSDRVDGLLYDRHDDAQLMSHMRWVLDHPAESLRIASAGVQRVSDRFTMERIMDETERYLRSIVRSHA